MLTGQKIAKLRTKQNMTQEQLAEKLFISRELVSKWETNKRVPDHKTVLKLAEIFSVKPEEITNQNEIMLNELSDCIPDRFSGDPDTLATFLNAFLAELNERERSIFVRRYYFSEEISEIADKYEIKPGYIRTILMRTRKKMKKFFKVP